MFKKLISNLPFNPSLIGEVAFYYRRLQSEEKLRRLGVVLVVLSFFIQSFAVLSPPQPTLAESDNDVIRGGFANRDQATLHCLGDTQGFRDVLAYHGLSCDDVAAAQTVTIRSTDYNKELDSMGRQSKGSHVERTGKPTNEYPVGIGGTTFYMRNLWAFDSGAYSTYKALKMQNKHGATIFILYSCGNIVTVGKYTPPAPTPDPAPAPNPTPTPTPTETPEPEPVDACPLVPGFQDSLAECDVCPNIDGIQYSFDACDVCPNVPGVQTNQNECYPCPEAEDSNAVTACLELDKTASNLTQGIDDADGTRANAGDTIVYTLSVKNKGTQAVADFKIEEDMADVLHYAEITDANGGTLNKNVLSWPAETIPAGQTVSKTITIKVDPQIKSTPTSVSDPSSHDLMMTNVFFGNEVNISLPQPIGKTAETVVQTLPKTGPGESMLVASLVTIMVSYFLARAYLLRKETQLVKAQFAAGSN